MDTIHWIIIGILLFTAYVGLLVPNVPDMPFALAAFVYYHFFVDPQFGWFFWTMAISFTLVFTVIDYIAGGIAAKKFGGSRWSLLAAPIGAILLIWLPFGIILGPLLGVFMVEYYRTREWEESIKISFTTMIGFLGGMVVKFVLMSIFVLWFLIAIA